MIEIEFFDLTTKPAGLFGKADVFKCPVCGKEMAYLGNKVKPWI